MLLIAQAPAPGPEPAEPYLFSSFTNNGEDGLHLLSSADGVRGTALNGGRSFLYPAVGSRLMRDPSEATGERWRLTPSGIEWTAAQVAAGPKPHDDHIEMSGLRVSSIVHYGVDRSGNLILGRRAIWPMLRTIPNDTGASLQQAFGAG